MSLWEYHSKIFQPYIGWCNHVGLHQRPVTQADTFAKSEPYSDSVACMLLNELALYMCIWTEGANLRYMPELTCFLYHVLRFSSNFEELLQSKSKGAAVPTDPEAVSVYSSVNDTHSATGHLLVNILLHFKCIKTAIM